MSNNGTRTIILDTDILLHYERVDQIDWPKELGATDVMLIITPVVMEEMEKHKALHPSKRIRKRAGDYVKWINSQIVDDSLQAEIRSNAHLKMLDAEPTVDFGSNRLNREVEDDRLIAHAIQWAEHYPDAPATILTADTGVRMKALGRNLPVMLWEDNEHKLPPEPDPEDKKIKDLEAKVRKYESRVPVLRLEFCDGEQHCQYALAEDSAERIAVKMTDLKWQYPKLQAPAPRKQITPTGNSMIDKMNLISQASFRMSEPFIRMSETGRQQYNERLDKFYEKYERFLEELSYYQSHVIRLDILLANQGTCVANNVDVELQFPQSMRVSARYKLQAEPKPPEKPDPFDYLGMRHSFPDINPRLFSTPAIVPIAANVLGPHFESQNIVHYEVKRAKHNLPVELDSLFVDYETSDDVEPFAIDYRLFADDISDVVSGKLHVIVQRGSTSGGDQS